jgi:hypothetical protein
VWQKCTVSECEEKWYVGSVIVLWRLKRVDGPGHSVNLWIGILWQYNLINDSGIEDKCIWKSGRTEAYTQSFFTFSLIIKLQWPSFAEIPQRVVLHFKIGSRFPYRQSRHWLHLPCLTHKRRKFYWSITFIYLTENLLEIFIKFFECNYSSGSFHKF